MVTILGLCLVPVLQLLVHYLLYKLVAALAATMGQSRVCGLVEQIGGVLEVDWRTQDDHVRMTGPSHIVFEGEYRDEADRTAQRA